MEEMIARIQHNIALINLDRYNRLGQTTQISQYKRQNNMFHLEVASHSKEVKLEALSILVKPDYLET